MKNVGIIYNNRIPEALDLSMAILHQLELPEDSWYSPAENLESLEPRAKGTDLVITVGGRRHHPAGHPIRRPGRHSVGRHQHGPLGVYDRADR